MRWYNKQIIKKIKLVYIFSNISCIHEETKSKLANSESHEDQSNKKKRTYTNISKDTE